MVRFTFRMPEKLVSTIDEMIEKEGRYSTRPDFIVSAVRNTLLMFCEHRAQVIGLMKTDARLREVSDMLPMISTSAGAVLLNMFDEYGVKDTSVLITMPDGLKNLLLKTISTLNICETMTEFIQMSVIAEIENNSRVDRILSDAMKFVEDERASKKLLLEGAVSAILEGRSQDIMGEVVSSMFNAARPVQERPKD